MAVHSPNGNKIIDEQLFTTKARCPFMQYIVGKTGQIGISFLLAVDAKIKYLLNAFLR